MSFLAKVEQARASLEAGGRISLRALQREFDLYEHRLEGVRASQGSRSLEPDLKELRTRLAERST